MAVNENPGILLYTRIRKSPYFYASRQHGVQKYSVYNHTYHPRHYRDPVDEYWALVNGVTLWDVGVEKQIQIKGKDAFDLTNMIVPRDLNKCAVDQCKYVFITAPDGGILNDPVLLRVAEDEFWLSLADSDVNLYALGIASARGMDVSVREIDVAPVQIQGPNAKKVMTELFGDAVLDIPYYSLMKAELDGKPVVELRLHEAVVGDVENRIAEELRHHLLRVRTLDLDRRDVDLANAHVHAPGARDAERVQVHVAVGEREPELVLRHSKEDRVVQDPAVRRGDEHVLALVDGTLVEVAWDDHVRQIERVGALDLDLLLD